LTTDKNGKFSGEWEAELRLDGGAYDFYAYYEGASDVSYARSQTHSVTIVTASGSSYVPSSTSSYNYEPTEITLNLIPKTATIGQTITFSGKLTSNGQPLSNAKVWIKDEDPIDIDDYLTSAITDSQGRFSAKWTVKDVESDDRKYGSLALGAYFGVPLHSVNEFINVAEFNTIEIFAAFESTGNQYLESNTCTTQYASDGSVIYCRNNVIVINNPVDLESTVINMLLGNSLGGISDESDILYSILGSNDPSDAILDEFEEALLEAIQEELGINQDLSMQQMLELLDDPSLASQYQSKSSYSPQQSSTTDYTADYDGDGIPDYRDECKYTKENYNGYQDTDGCFDIKPIIITPTIPTTPTSKTTGLLTLSLFSDGKNYGHDFSTKSGDAVQFAGKLTDEKGNPVRFTTVYINDKYNVGFQKRTTTDENGNYLYYWGIESSLKDFGKGRTLWSIYATSQVGSKIVTSEPAFLTVLTQTTIPTTPAKLPDWIKNNAAWWSSGAIEDRDFAKGIEYMVKEKIIRIPKIETEKEMATFSVEKIPHWIKNNAKWWSEGKITDEDFAVGIQYMVKEGIIRI